jgi:hypothetical protein
LRAIKASVPDASGKFETPKRQKAEQVRADDELRLAGGAGGGRSPALPGRGRRVLADVAILRALATLGLREAAAAIVDVAFAPDTMIYRDECGRRLRAMAPQSVPALTIASQSTRPRARATRPTSSSASIARSPARRWPRPPPTRSCASRSSAPSAPRTTARRSPRC